MKTCIICLRRSPTDCQIAICPNRSEHKHIGVDTGSNDVTAVAIISPTGELEELVSTEPAPTTAEPFNKDWELPWPNHSYRSTN